MTGLDHLNSRERAYRLAQRKARADEGRGWGDPAPVTSGSDTGGSPDDPDDFVTRCNVEVVKANVATLAHRHGFAYGWFGDQLRLQFPNSPEVVTVEDAVRRHLIGPGRRW